MLAEILITTVEAIKNEIFVISFVEGPRNMKLHSMVSIFSKCE